MIVGTLFIVLRGNYKRLFAYSSVEHMGIIAIALGFGGVLGFYGALLHTLTHAIGKAVLFLTSGDIVLRYRTRLIDEVRGVLSVTPLTGAVLLLAALAVAGSPPFGLFLSEFTIVRAGLAALEHRAGRRAAGPARDRVRRAGRRGGGMALGGSPDAAHGRAGLHRALGARCWRRRRWSPGSPCCSCSGCGSPAASIG